MLTSFSDDVALLDSIMAGAVGYVLKHFRGCDLVGAVRVVASGRSLLDPRAAGKVMAWLRDEANGHDRLARLTARERQVLELIGDGSWRRSRLMVSHGPIQGQGDWADQERHSLQVTRPVRKAPIAASCSLKWRCGSSSALCQSSSRPGPSMKPSADTGIVRMIFLVGVPSDGPGRLGGREPQPAAR